MNDDPTLFPAHASQEIALVGREIAALDKDAVSYQENVLGSVQQILEVLKDNTRRPGIRKRMIQVMAEIIGDVAYEI